MTRRKAKKLLKKYHTNKFYEFMENYPEKLKEGKWKIKIIYPVHLRHRGLKKGKYVGYIWL